MSNILDKGNSNAFQLTGGGTGAPWNWGVSPFDQATIDAATGTNIAAIGNRYHQLGMGGSTPEAQDKAGAAQTGEALTGELQTQNVGNPALNPALQPPVNQIIGQLGSQGSGNTAQTLGSLATAAGFFA